MHGFTWCGPLKYTDYELAFEWVRFHFLSARTTEINENASDTPVFMHDACTITAAGLAETWYVRRGFSPNQSL